MHQPISEVFKFRLCLPDKSGIDVKALLESRPTRICAQHQASFEHRQTLQSRPSPNERIHCGRKPSLLVSRSRIRNRDFFISSTAKIAVCNGMIMLDIIIEILVLIAYGTGEFFLYALNLRRQKPKWPDGAEESGTIRELAFSLSTCVGIIFWCAVLVLIAWLVSL